MLGMLVIGFLEGDRMSDGAWGRGVLVSVVVGGDRTPEGMVAGAAPLSVLGCDGEMGGVLGGWGGDRTPEGMKAGAAHFSPHFTSVGCRGGGLGGFECGFGVCSEGGGCFGAVLLCFVNRLRRARRS